MGCHAAVTPFRAAHDPNGDGQVEEAEFAVLLKARGRSDADCALAFAHLDTDGDGSISLQEYVDAVHQYYTNPAEGTPGNRLYPRTSWVTSESRSRAGSAN